MTVPALLSGMCLWSVVLWGLGWRSRVILQPSDTNILHLCSHRNHLIILKVTLGWAAAAGPFGRSVPPLVLIGSGDCFPAHCGRLMCRGKDFVELGVFLPSSPSGSWNITPFLLAFLHDMDVSAHISVVCQLMGNRL